MNRERALDTTLQGCRVVRMLQNMYANEDRGERRFYTDCYGNYGTLGRFRTDYDDLLIVNGRYITSIVTPLGTLTCACGSISISPFLEKAISSLDFDMVLIKEGYQEWFGYLGPWYQITRVGDVHFPLRPYEEIKTFMSDTEAAENQMLVAEQVLRQRIHTDRLGLTEKLLAGQPFSTKEFRTSAPWVDWAVKAFDQNYQQGVIRWDLWWHIIYSSRNMAVEV